MWEITRSTNCTRTISPSSNSNQTVNLTGADYHSFASLSVFGYLLIPIMITGTVSNTMVIVSILRNKKLRNESINHLILSLCCADYVILLLDRPVLAYIFVTANGESANQPTLVGSWCYTQTFFESFGMTALLLNLAILSFERFLSIRHPLEIIKKKQRIAYFVTGSWILAVACGVGAAVIAEGSLGSYHVRVCQSSTWVNWGYFDYVVIPLGAVTTVFIASMYGLIMRMVRVHVSSTSTSFGGATKAPSIKSQLITFHNKVSSEPPTPSLPLPLVNFPTTVSSPAAPQKTFTATPAFRISGAEKLSDVPEKPSADGPSTGSLLKAPTDTQQTDVPIVSATDCTTVPPTAEPFAPPLASARRRTTVDVYDVSGNVTVEVMTEAAAPVGAVCRYNPKNREAARRKMELATAKKSLAIVASFFLCWLPLPLCHLSYTGLVRGARGTWWTFIPSLTLTLAATINPLVYAFVNKQIRQSCMEFWVYVRQGAKKLCKSK